MRETSLDFFEKQYPAAMGYFPDGVLTEEGLAAIEAAGEPFREWRLGLDGQWDREIGLWMEGMVVHQDAPRPLFKYLQMTTVGADYTLGIGSGLHVLGEHLVSRSYNLLPVYTVYENVELPLLFLKTPAAQRRQSVLQSLEWVGLTDKLESRPSQLSGGECQRVSIARAMVKTPEIVLADEPTANLDARNSHNILQTMEKLNRDLHTTFIFATHDEKVIQYLRRKIS